jgi:acyl-CoA thioesterase
MNNTKTVEKVELELEPEVDDVLRPSELPIPSMNVSVSAQKQEEKPLVTNDEMVDMYKKIINHCEEDRSEANELFQALKDMVINDGDASHSTKEAMIQSLRIRCEASDKETKVMDLLMRYILKDRDTFPRYLAANQENNIIFKSGSKRSFLEKLEKQKARKIEERK